MTEILTRELLKRLAVEDKFDGGGTELRLYSDGSWSVSRETDNEKKDRYWGNDVVSLNKWALSDDPSF